MNQWFEFLADNLLLSGLFVVVLVAWIAWEVSRLTRKWQEVDTLGAVRFINQQDPLIVDVSNSTDFQKSHIAGAVHLPPSKLTSGSQALTKELNRPVLVYCRSGQVSAQMANKLVKLGFEDVKMLSGGLAQWESDKQPVSQGKSKPKKADKKGGKKKDDN